LTFIIKGRSMNQSLNSLITLSDPRSPAAEAFRTLRTNIYFSSLDQTIQTLVVTSAAPAEGKSTVLANLAVAMAQGDRTTILVDADLRRPTVHEIFGLKNDAGLTSLFIDKKSVIDPTLQDVSVPNLQVLTSGPLPPNPAEVLGSKRMLEVIADLKTRADMILFDAPPVIAVTDASVLGTRVDGVLLVINSGHTRREHAKRAKAQLEKLNIRVVGAVLNGTSIDSAMGGYYSA
jgi:protein-tyrosine kinase